MRNRRALPPALITTASILLSWPATAAAPAAVSWASLDPGNDWSATVLKSLFPLPGLTGGQSIGTGTTVITQLAGQFTSFVAVIAMAFFAYTIIMHIFRAAESSQLLGNNQSWMSVVRTGFAAVMMFPISGGFSSGQWLVMQGALWGAGMAKAAYTYAVTAVGPDAAVIAIPMIPGTQSLVLGIIRSELCMDLVNLASATASATPLIPTPGVTTISDSTGGYASVRYSMSNGNASTSPVCGTVTMRQSNTTPTTIAGITVDMAAVQASVFNNVVTGSIRPAVGTIAQQVWLTKKPDALSGLNGVYTNAVRDYTGALTAAATSVQSNINSALSSNASQARNGGLDLQASGVQQSTLGWTAAGAYYLAISRANAATLSLLSGLPTSSSPNYQGLPRSLAADMAPMQAMTDAFLATLQAVVNSQDGITQPTGAPSTLASAQDADSMGTLGRMMSVMNFNGNTINKIVAMFNQSTASVWTDPFGNLMQLGQTLIILSLSGMGLAAAASSTIGSTAMIAGGLVSGGIGGAVAAAGVSAVINYLALPVFVFLMAMLTPGIIISYVLPLIPYTLWIAGVTGWIILVCEAMIAVPLWMLAHMTMGGDGLHGRAVEGWGLLFNVMFRPVLMVLGLFLSFFVFSAISWLIRQSFGIAANFALAGGNVVTNFLGLVVMLNIFVMTEVTAAFMSFRMIALLPHHLPRMIGFTGASRVDMDAFAERAANSVGSRTAVGMQQTLTKATSGFSKDAKRLGRQAGRLNGPPSSMDSTERATTDL